RVRSLRHAARRDGAGRARALGTLGQGHPRRGRQPRLRQGEMSGPLSGVKIIEFESIGPAPFAGMLLADMGADVLVIDRPAATDLGLKRDRPTDVMMRGKRSVTLDLKAPNAAQAALELVAKADALIEG